MQIVLGVNVPFYIIQKDFFKYAMNVLNYKDIPEDIRNDFDICEDEYLKIKMTNKKVTIEVIKSNDKK